MATKMGTNLLLRQVRTMNERSTKFFATLPTHSDLTKTEIVGPICLYNHLLQELSKKSWNVINTKSKNFHKKYIIIFQHKESTVQWLLLLCSSRLFIKEILPVTTWSWWRRHQQKIVHYKMSTVGYYYTWITWVAFSCFSNHKSPFHLSLDVLYDK